MDVFPGIKSGQQSPPRSSDPQPLDAVLPAPEPIRPVVDLASMLQIDAAKLVLRDDGVELTWSPPKRLQAYPETLHGGISLAVAEYVSAITANMACKSQLCGSAPTLRAMPSARFKAPVSIEVDAPVLVTTGIVSTNAIEARITVETRIAQGGNECLLASFIYRHADELQRQGCSNEVRIVREQDSIPNETFLQISNRLPVVATYRQSSKALYSLFNLEICSATFFADDRISVAWTPSQTGATGEHTDEERFIARALAFLMVDTAGILAFKSAAERGNTLYTASIKNLEFSGECDLNAGAPRITAEATVAKYSPNRRLTSLNITLSQARRTICTAQGVFMENSARGLREKIRGNHEGGLRG